MSGRGKGGKGLGKGGAKRHRKILRDNIQGLFLCVFHLKGFLTWTFRYYEACYSSSCTSWWCEAYFWSDLWGDSWCFEDLPWKCVLASVIVFDIFLTRTCSGYPGLSNIHWACKEENSYCTWCCLCPEEVREDAVWFRCMSWCWSLLFSCILLICGTTVQHNLFSLHLWISSDISAVYGIIGSWNYSSSNGLSLYYRLSLT